MFIEVLNINNVYFCNYIRPTPHEILHHSLMFDKLSLTDSHFVRT